MFFSYEGKISDPILTKITPNHFLMPFFFLFFCHLIIILVSSHLTQNKIISGTKFGYTGFTLLPKRQFNLFQSIFNIFVILADLVRWKIVIKLAIRRLSDKESGPLFSESSSYFTSEKKLINTIFILWIL